MNDYEECSIGGILLDIHERQCFFFKSDTMEMVRPFDYLNKYLPDKPTDEDYKKLPSLESLNIYQFPIYEYINHKFIMSEYVKNCCDDKQIRQELFYILRRYNYLDMFCDCLKKHNLYDHFRNCSSLYYGSIFRK